MSQTFTDTTTLLFGTTGFAPEITSVNFTGMSRPKVLTSHLLTTGYDTFVNGPRVDPGDLVLGIFYDAGDNPPIDTDPEVVTVTYPGGAIVGTASFATGLTITGQMGDLITSELTIGLSGEPAGM